MAEQSTKTTPKKSQGRVSTEKKPEKTRKVKMTFNPDEVYGNRLGIPQEIIDWAKDNGMSKDNFKWIRADDVYKNQGYHPSGWIVFRDESGIIKSEFGISSDPSGVVRRGDLLLGFKPPQQYSKHKAYLRARADRYNDNKLVKTQANQLKQIAGNSNVKIHMGLDDKDE